MLSLERAQAWADHLARCGRDWALNVPMDASHVDRDLAEVYLDGYLIRRTNFGTWQVSKVDGGES